MSPDRISCFFRLAALACALPLAGCLDEARPPRQPAFYASLASPGARLDLVSARDLINDYRRAAGLPMVEIDGALQSFAEAEAARLARADRIDATRSTPLAARLAGVGVARAKSLENVSAGYHTMSDAFSGWRGAPAHDATLRMREARAMGIATAYNPASKYRVYWVIVMATQN
jgi:uncharacterized protein YkwD